jgi:hypothetical protein
MKSLQSKTYYCPNCGYSHRTNFIGIFIENPIYAIGLLSKHKDTALFKTKKDYLAYKKAAKEFVFAPFINSPNLMK